MTKYVVHKQVYRRGPFGGVVNRTVCGKQANGDDMNATDGQPEVTCKLCLRMLESRPELGTSISF